MSAARVLIEEQWDPGVAQTVNPQRNVQRRECVGHEGLVIVGVAIVIAVTLTIAVMGSILMALSLRGSGVMGIL